MYYVTLPIQSWEYPIKKKNNIYEAKYILTISKNVKITHTHTHIPPPHAHSIHGQLGQIWLPKQFDTHTQAMYCLIGTGKSCKFPS